jgi:hypothetical protein
MSSNLPPITQLPLVPLPSSSWQPSASLPFPTTPFQVSASRSFDLDNGRPVDPLSGRPIQRRNFWQNPLNTVSWGPALMEGEAWGLLVGGAISLVSAWKLRKWRYPRVNWRPRLGHPQLNQAATVFTQPFLEALNYSKPLQKAFGAVKAALILGPLAAGSLLGLAVGVTLAFTQRRFRAE